MSRPAVCVGIVTHNRADSLTKAIGSALQQRSTNVHVAVLDDASTDETIGLPVRFPEVTWIRREVSGGYISARNELMARADFDYFVSLDDDAWFLEGDEIAAALGVLEQDRHVAAVAFDILSPDRPNRNERTTPRPIAMFYGCGHVLRMAAVHRAGAYELTPGSYGSEEKDLSLRLMDAGYKIIRLPGVHVWHDKTMVARQFAEQYRSGVCNDLVLTLRRTPAALMPLALVVKFWQHLRFGFSKQLLWPCLEGFRMFFRHLPETCQSRRPVKLSTLREFMRLARRR